MKLNYGDLALQQVSGRIGEPVATVAALGALPVSRCVNGQVFHVLADNSLWQFNSASVLTADNILVAGAASAGRFLRMPGGMCLQLPIAFGTADLAVLLTMQAGQAFAVERMGWRVTADFTGGTASAIGVHSNKTTPTNWSTAGDLLGGVGGDVAATLVASGGYIPGTVGADMDTLAKVRGLILEPTDTLIFGRIVSAFTAGTGFVLVNGTLISNLGA